jgi:hypothetical protein
MIRFESGALKYSNWSNDTPSEMATQIVFGRILEFSGICCVLHLWLCTYQRGILFPTKHFEACEEKLSQQRHAFGFFKFCKVAGSDGISTSFFLCIGKRRGGYTWWTRRPRSGTFSAVLEIRKLCIQVSLWIYSGVPYCWKTITGFSSSNLAANQSSTMPRKKTPFIVSSKRKKNVVQTVFGVHPTSYSMGDGGSFPAGKAAGAWS